MYFVLFVRVLNMIATKTSYLELNDATKLVIVHKMSMTSALINFLKSLDASADFWGLRLLRFDQNFQINW